MPDRASSVQPVDVVIHGTGFLATVQQPASGGTPTLVTTHRAWLDEVELADVTWVDAQTLRAKVPAGVPVGQHALVVQNAIGARGSLPGAYTVVPVDAFAGVLSLDRASLGTGEQFTMTVMLRNGGDGELTGIACSSPVLTTTDGGGARLVGGDPSPPTSIPANGERTLAWTFQATAAGHISLAVTATAVEAATGRTVNAALAGAAQVTIQPPGTPAPPGPPSGLTATAVSQNRIDVAWNAVTGSTGYVVLRGTASGGPYAQVATTTTPGYSDTSASAAATYYYVVQATNAGGASANSAEVSATTPAPPPTAPAVPTGLIATAVSQTRIDVRWNAVSAATGYVVLRGATSGGPYVQIGTAPSARYTDTANLVAATTYYYVVRATSAGGTSANSLEASATIPAPPPPPAPSGVNATAVSQTRIDVTWDSVGGATGYVVLRGTTSGGPYAQVATTTTPGYSDTSVSASTTYYYVVQAANAGGWSSSSAEVSATTPAPPPTAPAAPSDVSATAVTQDQIEVGWNAVADATGYAVLRGTASGGPYVQIATPTTASYSDTGLAAMTTYYYVVRATSAGGTSSNSAEVSATTPAPPPPPPPSGLTATAVSQNRIDVAWNAVSAATGYVVLRGTTSGGAYAQVATTTVPGYADTSVSASTTYYYVVQATNAGGTSFSSSEASATTPAPPPTALAAPTGLTATAASQAQIGLTWNGVLAATGYVVLRGTASGGPYDQIAMTTTPSFSDVSGLSPSTTYYYVVQATNAAGSSPYSTETSATTLAPPPPPAPTGLVAKPLPHARISLTWNVAAGATAYDVFRSTVKGGPYAHVGTTPTTTATTYMDSGLTAATTYYYVVQAVNAGGNSANSAEASAKATP